MNVNVIKPFVNAACSVISTESGEPVKPSHLKQRGASIPLADVTVMIGLTGTLRGTIALMMPMATALALLERMTGEPQEEFGSLGKSAIAEIANVISGQAGTELSATGHETTISPPTVVVQSNDAHICTPAIPMYAIGLETACGAVELDLALAEAA